MIREVQNEGRRRYYQITEKGLEMLKKEYRRLQLLVEEGRYAGLDDMATLV